MANQSHAGGKPKVSLEELQALGVAAVTFPSALLFAAAGGVNRALAALARDRSFAAVEDELISLDGYYEVVGLKPMLEREKRYDDNAARLAGPRKDAAE
jgi:2-methylisocitrate lyase-like PEP mutase family enzyme